MNETADSVLLSLDSDDDDDQDFTEKPPKIVVRAHPAAVVVPVPAPRILQYENARNTAAADPDPGK